MAFTTTPAIGGGSAGLPVDVVNEVRADWSTADLYDSVGLPACSVVTFPLGSDATSRSNQTYDVVEVARTSCQAAMGDAAYAAKTAASYFVGSRSSVSKAVEAVAAKAATANKPEVLAVEAVPAMLTVQTYWKLRKA
jgi:hypothetical protein